MLFNKTLIIGLGLIGGSFAKTLRKLQLSNEIIGYDIDDETINLASLEKVIDSGFINLEVLSLEELNTFDLIVIAAPLSSYEEIFAEISEVKSLVIDLGSVKNFSFKQMPQNFVPCHPIAGLEEGGFENSRDDLFENKKFIICKKDEKISQLIKEINATEEFLESEKHDEIYGLVSHLPQFLSFLTAEFSPENFSNEFLQKSFRLNNSDSEIWGDIFSMNEENLEKFYVEFFENIVKIAEDSFIKIDENFSQGFGVEKKINLEEIASKEVLVRFIVVLSYLKIKKIKEYSSFAGSGFRDFASIVLEVNFDEKSINDLLALHQEFFENFIESIY